MRRFNGNHRQGQSVVVAHTRSAALLALLLFGTARCAYDWEAPSSMDAITTDFDDAGSSDSDGGNGGPDSSAHDGGSGDAKSDAKVAAYDASCSPSVECETGSFCKYADNACGNGAEAGTGVCTQVDDSKCGADAAVEPVCACDGTIYPSTCAARKDGQDVSPTVACTTPTGTFRCGYAYCTSNEFCVETGGGDAGDAATAQYTCAPLNNCALGCGCAATKTACNGSSGSCAGLPLGLGVEVVCK